MMRGVPPAPMRKRYAPAEPKWWPMIRYRRRQCPGPMQVIASASRNLASAALVAWALAASAGIVHAQSFGVATWNLNWLMDADTHARWATACAREGWPAQTDALPAPSRAALAGLPYCNVHNGMQFPPEACRATRDGWPQAARYPADHPCPDTAH